MESKTESGLSGTWNKSLRGLLGRLLVVVVTILLSAGSLAAGGIQTKKAGEAKKTSGKSTAKKSRTKRGSSRKKRVAKKPAARPARSGTAAGRTTAERRRALAAARARRQRIYLARLRALRAREGALRSIAASNIDKDDNTGEDLEIRRVAIDALEGRSGTVVVMDPMTGRVFTIVNQRMAVGSPVKPCSTIKMVVALAALREGVFDPTTDVPISTRASMSLTDALARSNNPVFQVLGRRLGFEKVMRYADNYGLGRPTGVNYPGESPGFMPEEGDQETGHMSSHGDGFGITAIQLAAFTSAVANGGKLYEPRVPRSPEELSNFEPKLIRQIEMTPEDRMQVMSGLIGAVNFGTGRLSYNALAQVAGKTGTCTGENDIVNASARGRDKLGLFTSFSSADNPKVAVTVITTGYQEAGKRAAEIAGRIYAAISPRFFREKSVIPATEN